MSGQCLANTSWQNLSCSQKATVSIPARSKPKEKPPMPENKSKTLIDHSRTSSVNVSYDGAVAVRAMEINTSRKASGVALASFRESVGLLRALPR